MQSGESVGSNDMVFSPVPLASPLCGGPNTLLHTCYNYRRAHLSWFQQREKCDARVAAGVQHVHDKAAAAAAAAAVGVRQLADHRPPIGSGDRDRCAVDAARASGGWAPP